MSEKFLVIYKTPLYEQWAQHGGFFESFKEAEEAGVRIDRMAWWYWRNEVTGKVEEDECA